jgi:ADP-heptose:LPS heptosyltransferase
VRVFDITRDAGDPAVTMGEMARDRHRRYLNGGGIDTGPNAFEDTAAIVELSDLVITCDTSIGHLGAALGKPVWLALSFQSECRWGIGTDRTPLYPLHRLFRQPAPGDWEHVLHAMKVALADMARQRIGA